MDCRSCPLDVHCDRVHAYADDIVGLYESNQVGCVPTAGVEKDIAGPEVLSRLGKQRVRSPWTEGLIELCIDVPGDRSVHPSELVGVPRAGHAVILTLGEGGDVAEVSRWRRQSSRRAVLHLRVDGS